MSEQPELFKELVIGYIVTENVCKNRKQILSTPITTANDVDYGIKPLYDDFYINAEERVIGIIPAPFPTYCIKAVAPNGDIFTLGYEHPTLKPQYWKEAYEHAMKNKSWYEIGER